MDHLLENRLIHMVQPLYKNGKIGMKRFKTMFGNDKLKGVYWEETKKLRREGLTHWFVTRTAKETANRLAAEMGLFE